MVFSVKPCCNVQLTQLRFLLRDSEGKHKSELEYDRLKVKVYTYNSLERFYSLLFLIMLKPVRLEGGKTLIWEKVGLLTK